MRLERLHIKVSRFKVSRIKASRPFGPEIFGPKIFGPDFGTFSFSPEEISKSPDRDHLDVHQCRMYTNENLGTSYPALLNWTSLVLSVLYKKSQPGFRG